MAPGWNGIGDPFSAVSIDSSRACGWMAARSRLLLEEQRVMSWASVSGIDSETTSRLATATTGTSGFVL